ncbi:metallophosphoesterase [Kitasatospora sp. NPDC088346]|uniref:metallophosphoesterase n=1 Tax=Kitasatospora sp. NPDC088346 TaxID=3364073 RepID=UPI003813587F
MIVIAHLSDLHLDGGVRAEERARAVLDHLEGLPFELAALLVTGDVADHGLPAEYEQARRLLVSRHPVLVGPGNHDERAAFRTVLLGQAGPAGSADAAGPAGSADAAGPAGSADAAGPAGSADAAGPAGSADAAGPAGPVNQVHRGDGFVLALCDSSVPGRDHGLLDDRTLAWLEEEVAATPAGVPVLVAFHHPPAALHEPFIDGIRQFGEERLAELARRRPSIAGFLCGHAHTPAATTFAGRPLLVAPGVTSTLRLPWERRAHREDVVHLDLPPALAFHVLSADGRLTTHFRTVPVRPTPGGFTKPV